MTRFNMICTVWLLVLLSVIAFSAALVTVPGWVWAVIGAAAIILIGLAIAGAVTQMVDEWRAEADPDAVLEPARDHGRRAA